MKPGRVRDMASLFGSGALVASPVGVEEGEEDSSEVLEGVEVVRVESLVPVVVAPEEVGEAVVVSLPVALGVSSRAVPVVPLTENFGVKLKLSGFSSSMIWML